MGDAIAEWYWYFHKRPHAKQLKKLLPVICEILGIDSNDNLTIWIRKRFTQFHNFIYEGSFYNFKKQTIYISLDEIETVISGANYFSEWMKDIPSDKMNWEVYVLAHELAHHQQYVTGKAQFGRTESMWLGECKSNFDYKTHYDKPWEIDANIKAKDVIEELIARGLL